MTFYCIKNSTTFGISELRSQFFRILLGTPIIPFSLKDLRKIFDTKPP